MKTVNLRIGAKGQREAVTVPVRIAENLEDIQTLTKGNLGILTRCFNRGFRIESQERSGARDAFKAGEPVEALMKLVAEYDPTVVVKREGRPRKPVEIKLARGKKSYTPDELQALLAAAGVKANLVTEGEAQPATK